MHDWSRFWCPISGKIHLGEDGYLIDPDGSYGKQLNPDVLVLTEVDDAPCLVLLGEPGIGKSTVVRQHIEATTLKHGSDAVCHVDLGDYGDEGRLIADVFRSDRLQQWHLGQETLQLFLDGLDECRLQIPQVAKIISRELGRCGTSLARLRLRIACRTADWPQTLTQQFAAWWGSESVLEYELAPLRRSDVRLAARNSGVDAEPVDYLGFVFGTLIPERRGRINASLGRSSLGCNRRRHRAQRTGQRLHETWTNHCRSTLEIHH